MALTQLTKIDGRGINTTSDYRVGILTAIKFVGPFDGTGGNFAGVVTATNGVFSGNVTIGGTLTYEDVTNIDSVGIITARDGFKVLGGGANIVGVVTATGADINGDLDVDGHTNLDNISIAGITTISGTTPILDFTETDGNPDYRLTVDGGLFKIRNLLSGTYTSIFTINTDGHVDIAGNTDFAAGIDVTGNATFVNDIDVDGHTNLDNVSVAGVSTFSGNVTVDAGANTTLDVVADSAGVAMVRTTGASGDQTTAAFELRQSTSSIQGGGISYNGDGSPGFVSGETADHVTFYRILNGTRSEVFSYPYNSDTVTFNSTVIAPLFQGNLTGTVNTAAQPNITSIGTLGSLTVSGTSNPVSFTHTGGNCVTFNRNSKQLAINANYAGGNAYSNIVMSSGMDIRWTLGGADRIVFKSAGHIEPQTDSQINLGSNSVRFANVYADTYYGDGSNLTGIVADKIFEGNTEVETVDTGSDGHIKFTTEGTERLRITSAGKVGMGLVDAGGTGCDPDGNHLLIRGASTFQTNKGHIMLTGDSATVGQGPQIVFSESGGGSNNAGAYIGHVRQGSNSIGDLVFGTRATSGDASTVPDERLRITSGGNVNIGGDYTQTSRKVMINSASNSQLELKGVEADIWMHSTGPGNTVWRIMGATGNSTHLFRIYDQTNTTNRLTITSGGNVNIGGDWTQTTYTMKVTGSFAATTKSFVIDHPTKENHSLRYACLEGPENSVYVRGKTSKSVIELPDYWKGLVHEESITVNVTPIGNHKVWVEAINNNSVTIGSDGSEYFYTVFAERKDVEKLEVEVAK